MNELKICKRCKKSKSVSEFYSNNRCQSCKDYYDNYYKTHREKEIKRSLIHINKDRVKTNAYKRSLIRKNPRNYMLQNARYRAKKLGLPFNLTIDDIVIPEVCPILGLALKISDTHVAANSPSLDKIIPQLGYVKNNIIVISHKANTMKNNATLEELEKLVEWLKKELKV